MGVLKRGEANPPPFSEYVKRMTDFELERAFFSPYLKVEHKMMIAQEYWDRTGKPITHQ
jgi:hypothetical protein